MKLCRGVRQHCVAMARHGVFKHTVVWKHFHLQASTWPVAGVTRQFSLKVRTMQLPRQLPLASESCAVCSFDRLSVVGIARSNWWHVCVHTAFAHLCSVRRGAHGAGLRACTSHASDVPGVIAWRTPHMVPAHGPCMRSQVHFR